MVAGGRETLGACGDSPSIIIIIHSGLVEAFTHRPTMMVMMMVFDGGERHGASLTDRPT